MAHRSIGQGQLGFATGSRDASSLDELDRLIDRKPIAAMLSPLYPATKGEPALACAGDVQGAAAVGLV